jgi:transcriptional regulator with XRE-family HTH domain
MIAAMNLAAFLDQHCISDEAFAEKIGVERQTVHRYRSGERRPTWAVLEKIEKVTAGAVTANDFVATSAKPRRRARRAA